MTCSISTKLPARWITQVKRACSVNWCYGSYFSTSCLRRTDIDQAIESASLLPFSGRGFLQPSRSEAVATFMVNMLNDIEVTAESRKRFGLVEWMFNRNVAPPAEPYDLGAPQA